MELSFWLAKFELPWVNLSQRPTLIVSQICVSTPLEDPLSLFACPVPLPLDFFPYSFSFSSGPFWNGYYVAHLQHSNNIHIYNFHSDFVLQVQILKSSCSSIVFHHHFWHLTSTQPNFNISYPGQLHVFLFFFLSWNFSSLPVPFVVVHGHQVQGFAHCSVYEVWHLKGSTSRITQEV